MQLAGLGVTEDPETFFETLTKLFEETNHFVMGYRLLTSLSGKAPYIGDLRRYDIFRPDPELPENAGSAHLAKEKKAVEDDLARESAPWAQLAGDEGILEGGGAGAFFVGSRLNGGDFEQRVAEMMQVVLDDELRHGARQLEKLRDLPLTEEALLRCASEDVKARQAPHGAKRRLGPGNRRFDIWFFSDRHVSNFGAVVRGADDVCLLRHVDWL
jgi:hypothetical protein